MKRRLISIFVCISVMLLSLPMLSVQGLEWNELSPSDYTDYVCSIIPNLRNLPDVYLPEDTLYMSQPIEIQNDDSKTNYAVFLFDSQTCIGQLFVSYINGSMSHSFQYNEIPTVSNAYANVDPIHLYSNGTALILCKNSETEIIAGYMYSDDCEENLVHTCCQGATSCSLGEALVLTLVVPDVAPCFSGLPYSSHTLDVPFVPNESVNNVGICWAAATASIIRFLRPAISTSARGVYNTVLVEQGSASGNIASVLCGLTSYSVEGYVGVESSISFVSLTNQIDNGYPAYISMVGSDGTDTFYHGVVACGYYCESDGTDYLQILDSNESGGKIWISINRSTNAIVYNAGYGVYTVWRRTIYSSLVS